MTDTCSRGGPSETPLPPALLYRNFLPDCSNLRPASGSVGHAQPQCQPGQVSNQPAEGRKSERANLGMLQGKA